MTRYLGTPTNLDTQLDTRNIVRGLILIYIGRPILLIRGSCSYLCFFSHIKNVLSTVLFFLFPVVFDLFSYVETFQFYHLSLSMNFMLIWKRSLKQYLTVDSPHKICILNFYFRAVRHSTTSYLKRCR